MGPRPHLLHVSHRVACAITAILFTLLAQSPLKSRSEVISVRVLFGLTDTAPSRWDGTVSLDSGTVKAIQGWRFGPEDSTDYSHSWKAATRALGTGTENVLENGVLITAQAATDTRWTLHTPKGEFSFTLHEVPWGDRRTFLDGTVAVDRVPPTSQITTSDDDEDFPAIASSGDDIWISFVRFLHSAREMESFGPLPVAPADLQYLARPVGGDQVFAMHRSRSGGEWSSAVPISRDHEDIGGSTIAIDGENRVWVIWSARRNGAYDLYARANQNGFWGSEIRITSTAANNVNPVAATDSNGRVWVAWQGYRDNNLEILVSVENPNAPQDDPFVRGSVVSFSPANDWDPAIAASSDGDIAIAWDTYDKGDYDVWFRRLRAPRAGPIVMDAPAAVAASPNFEARPSIAFDRHDRLWVAYESATARWGKNFGAYETTGTPLYEDHNIRVKCFEGNSVFTTSGDLNNVMPGPPGPLRRERVPRPNRTPVPPNPNLARNRRPNQAVGPRSTALNSFPRLAVDSAGALYLAFRSLDGPVNGRSMAGSIWFEHLAWFDGHNWMGPVFLPRTDGLLDNRPALLSVEPGHLLAVSAMDHRQSMPQGLGPAAADRINSDLYSADLRLDGLAMPAKNPELMALPVERPALPDAQVKEEASQVALVRNYRIQAGGQQFQILRGELHRHTEYSVDGGREGSLEDAYRYMIDAAALDWGGCCDYENGGGHEYFWWTQQKMTDRYHLGDRFVSMFSFEHNVRYPEGHRNILLAQRGIRPIQHLPPAAIDSSPGPAPDTELLYKYLKLFGGISVPHASATDLGTDWRNQDPQVETAVEIYEGGRQSYESEGAPRAIKPTDAIAGWRSPGMVNAALDKGYRLGFVASSDHVSTHISLANVLVREPTREDIIDAFRRRHVYASTANIVADVRSSDHLMGDAFRTSGRPELSVKLIGTAPLTNVVVIKDGRPGYEIEPKAKEVSFTWLDNAAIVGKTSYYYVRGEQSDGQLVWTSPIWITVTSPAASGLP